MRWRWRAEKLGKEGQNTENKERWKGKQRRETANNETEKENREEKRRRALLSTVGGCLQNILDKIFQKKDAKIFGSSEIVAIFAIPFGKQANT